MNQSVQDASKSILLSFFAVFLAVAWNVIAQSEILPTYLVTLYAHRA